MSGSQILAIFGTLFLIGSAEVVTGPMMVQMGAHFGVRSSAIAYLPAAYGLTYAAVALVAGPLSDRLGRKRPLLVGLTGFALLTGLLPSAHSIDVAVMLAGAAGLCAAVIQPNALSLVSDLSPSADLGRRLGQVFSGLMLAFVVTPVIAGFVAKAAGWAAAYYCLSGLSAIATIFVAAVFRGTGASAGIRLAIVQDFLATHRKALRTPGAARRLSVSFLWLGWMAGFGAVSAAVTTTKLQFTADQAGLAAGLLGLAVVAGNILGGRIQGAMSRGVVVVAAMAAAIALLLLALPIGDTATVAGIGCVWALGYGFAGPLHHARLNLLDEALRGTFNSYHASLLNLGIFAVAGLMGAMLPVASVELFCLVVGLVGCAGACILWRDLTLDAT